MARPPIAVTNAVSWRSEGIKHRKNEIFLDVVEKLNLLVSSNGTVLNSEIVGAVKMKSFLSGAAIACSLWRWLGTAGGGRGVGILHLPHPTYCWTRP